MHHFLSVCLSVCVYSVLWTGPKMGENNSYLEKYSSQQYKILKQYATPLGLLVKNMNYTLGKFCKVDIVIVYMTSCTSHLQILRGAHSQHQVAHQFSWTLQSNPMNQGKVKNMNCTLRTFCRVVIVVEYMVSCTQHLQILRGTHCNIHIGTLK